MIKINDNLNKNCNFKESILIMDTAADQCTCGGSAWIVLHDTGKKAQCCGYLVGQKGATLPIVSAITCVEAEGHDPCLFLMNQACYHGNEEQTESLCHPYQAMDHGVSFCLTPNDTPTIKSEPGGQCMIVDEQKFPLNYDGRKMFLRIRRPSMQELKELETFEITSPNEYAIDDYNGDRREVNRRNSTRKYKEYPGGLTMDEWRRRLAMAPEDVVRKTFEATTQLSMSVEAENRLVPRQHYKSRFPFLREKRINDTFHSDTFFPSIPTSNNETCSQLFIGKNSDYMYVKPLRTESHSFTALQDFGRQVGIPNELKTDNAKTETGRKWTEWCRKFLVKTKFTEPHHPWQNYSEHGIGELSRMVKRCMRVFNAPMSRHGWCQQWCCRVRNSLASRKLNWRTPEERLTGNTPDLSVFRFHFWQEIEWYNINAKNPDDGWTPGRFLGINDNAGDSMTYFIETKSPNGSPVVITRSNVRAKRSEYTGLVSTSPSGETGGIHNEDSGQIDDNGIELEGDNAEREVEVQPNDNTVDEDDNAKRESEVQPNDNTVDDLNLYNSLHNGELEIEFQDDLLQNNENVSEGHFEDDALVDQQIADTLQSEEEDYEFRNIQGHYWKDGTLMFIVELTSGKTYDVPFWLLKKDRPIETAKHIRHKVVENKRGGRYEQWAKEVLMRAQRIIRRLHRHHNISRTMRLDAYKEIKMRRLSKNQQNKRKKNRMKFGIEVPNNVRHALLLDRKNGNKAWAEAISKEMTALENAGVWEFRPPNYKLSKGYQYAPLTLIFDVKQEDLRRKARLVAGGHVVDASMYESYSSVVQTRTIRILETIAMSEGLKFVTGDIGNAFVQANTNERIYSIAGPEFGEKEGSLVIIKKALYGLATSARQWSLTLGEAIAEMGFQPTRADPDLWIKLDQENNKYEYIATYVDDIIVVSKNPMQYINIIKEKFPLRNIEEMPEYYLGNNLQMRSNGTIKVSSRKYITEIISRYEKKYGSLRKENVPMAPNDHPELDDSPMLDEDGRRHYQSNIGICQWICTSGRLDIAFAVSSLSRFSQSPRENHLRRTEKILGYLKKYAKRGYIVDPRDPILNVKFDKIEADFGNQYSDFVEETDSRLPALRMKELSLNIFVDSNHGHDKVTGRSITGLISFIGRTPVYWAAKRQSAVQTATFGAEFVALKKAVEEAITLRYHLRSMGIAVSKPTAIYGDNLSAITNATIPSSALKKKYLALAYHFCREYFSAGIVDIRKIDGKDNYSDAMTKALVSNEFHGFMNEIMEN